MEDFFVATFGSLQHFFSDEFMIPLVHYIDKVDL